MDDMPYCTGGREEYTLKGHRGVVGSHTGCFHEEENGSDCLLFKGLLNRDFSSGHCNIFYYSLCISLYKLDKSN